MSEQKLKVLHLASHTGINAGGAIEMLGMATGMCERGHEVVCAFNWRDGKTGAGERNFEKLEQANIEYSTFRMESFLSRVLGDQRRFQRWVRERDFDVVHCHKPRAVRFALQTLRNWPTPKLVAHRGNSYAIDDNGRKWYGDPQMSALICVAEELRRIAIEGGLDARKTVTIYTGVDLRVFDANLSGEAVRREFEISDGTPVVGLLANFDGKKAHGEWLKAAVLVAREVPDVKFLLVGRGATDEFKASLRELGIEKNTILAGFRTDVPQCLAAMDVSINVSTRGEGLTGAMRESLAMRRPVVCTDIGGNRELVRNGETGILVPPSQPQQMADAVVRLLRDRDEAAHLAHNGYELVQREWTREKSLDRLEDIYFRVVEGRPVFDEDASLTASTSRVPSVEDLKEAITT